MLEHNLAKSITLCNVSKVVLMLFIFQGSLAYSSTNAFISSQLLNFSYEAAKLFIILCSSLFAMIAVNVSCIRSNTNLFISSKPTVFSIKYNMRIWERVSEVAFRQSTNGTIDATLQISPILLSMYLSHGFKPISNLLSTEVLVRK